MSGGPKKEGRKKSVPNELQRERERERERKKDFLWRTCAPPTFQAFFVPWFFLKKNEGKGVLDIFSMFGSEQHGCTAVQCGTLANRN